MGPKLLNALLCMHLHRVTMRAARKVGLIDRSMKHMNYELRGKNFTMCEWLGFSKEDNLYPNHVRAFTADELPTVPRRGFYYGLRCHADAVTSTANEQRDEDEASRSGLALPVGIPKPWLTTGALKAAQMSKQRTEPATGGGSASQPITPAAVPTVPTGHSFGVSLRISSNVLLLRSTPKFVSTSRFMVGKSFASAWIKPTSVLFNRILSPVTTPRLCSAALSDCAA